MFAAELCVSCLVAVCPLVVSVDFRRVFPLPQNINVRAQQSLLNYNLPP